MVTIQMLRLYSLMLPITNKNTFCERIKLLSVSKYMRGGSRT